MISGAQKLPLNAGTAALTHAGGLEKTVGPLDQFSRSAEDLLAILFPVEKM